MKIPLKHLSFFAKDSPSTPVVEAPVVLADETPLTLLRPAAEERLDPVEGREEGRLEEKGEAAGLEKEEKEALAGFGLKNTFGF